MIAADGLLLSRGLSIVIGHRTSRGHEKLGHLTVREGPCRFCGQWCCSTSLGRAPTVAPQNHESNAPTGCWADATLELEQPLSPLTQSVHMPSKHSARHGRWLWQAFATPFDLRLAPFFLPPTRPTRADRQFAVYVEPFEAPGVRRVLKTLAAQDALGGPQTA
jgi:hypothetical protein